MLYCVEIDMGIAILAVLLVLKPWTATSNLVSPIFEDVCKQVECGKGSCKPSDNITSPFECECSPGWKQARPFDDDFFTFLPCVIPNCTLDFSCSKGPSPVQEKEHQANESLFDVCRWNYCGGGTCNKTSLFTHKCECSEGSYNLFNLTFFPCFTDCSLGMDCKNLGISVTNKSTSSQPPSLSSNGSNQAARVLILQGSFNWLIIGSMFLVGLLAN